MSDVWIITAPLLQGLAIKQYKGLTIARSVRAVNIVRDFFTSFRDMFGGRSLSYQEVMDEMQYEIIGELKQQARCLGGNAIIGFRLDFDNIGSKGKSLLMGIGIGTAVVVEKPPQEASGGADVSSQSGSGDAGDEQSNL